jgi:hypothetical protein
MSARPRKDQEPSSTSIIPESGVVPLGSSNPDEAPPWTVVHAYLTRGEHAAWVEAHAARSRAFADVLAALRNDAEERQERARRGNGARKRTGSPFRR